MPPTRASSPEVSATWCANISRNSVNRVQPDKFRQGGTGSPKNRAPTQPGGPNFANLVLADEITRATPKTQSALLEAMQERTVTVGTQTRPLPSPFFVLATQNPIELEGTYPLPEAQLDRFFFKILVPFPAEGDLLEIARRTTGESTPQLKSVAEAGAVLAAQRIAREVPIAEHVLLYAARRIAP